MQQMPDVPHAGAGEAAFRVDGAKANIMLNSVTVNSGAQNLLLNVTSIDLIGAPFGSVVDFTVSVIRTVRGQTVRQLQTIQLTAR